MFNYANNGFSLQNIISYEWFEHSSIILFLNKKDLLAEKIKHSDLANYFPDFRGPAQDEDAAKNFILSMFEAVVVQGKNIYSYFTCATGNNRLIKCLISTKA